MLFGSSARAATFDPVRAEEHVVVCRKGDPEQMEGPHSLETADSRPLSGAELRGWAVAGQLSAAPRPRPARALRTRSAAGAVQTRR